MIPIPIDYRILKEIQKAPPDSLGDKELSMILYESYFDIHTASESLIMENFLSHGYDQGKQDYLHIKDKKKVERSINAVQKDLFKTFSITDFIVLSNVHLVSRSKDILYKDEIETADNLVKAGILGKEKRQGKKGLETVYFVVHDKNKSVAEFTRSIKNGDFLETKRSLKEVLS